MTGHASAPAAAGAAAGEAALTQVWWSRAEASPDVVAMLLDRLAAADPATAERARRLRSDDDRRRMVLGHALLRGRLASAAGILPGDVRVQRRCLTCGSREHGKPEPGGELAGRFQVNLSHAGDLVAVVVAPAGNGGGGVGIDVERKRPGVDWSSLRRHVMDAAEWARTEHDSDPEDLRWRAWARKEAVVKATGHGLASALAQVPVLPVEGAAREVAGWVLTRVPDAPGRVAVTDITLGDGPSDRDHVAAAAVHEPDLAVDDQFKVLKPLVRRGIAPYHENW